MRNGLFGKLHAKRDFIALATPRAFLNCWEPWLQAGISASRQSLGESWQQAFLQAPIWRFWLGGTLCGSPVIGAVMPSIDGVGRYYPLTVIAYDEALPDGAQPTLPPPELDTQEPWFRAAETFLFDTLEQDRPFEETTAALAALPYPAPSPAAEGAGPVFLHGGATLRAGTDAAAFAPAFAVLRLADQRAVYGGMSFWWTAGGDDYPQHASAFAGMPDPYFLASVLTGRFTGQASG